MTPSAIQKTPDGGVMQTQAALSADERLRLTGFLRLAIYDAMAAKMPNLFPSPHRANGKLRGPQKRHLVVSYLRRHPEELRPYMRGFAAKA
jgi:predicted DNA-binding transcriptional regulator AlpA